MYLFSRSIVEQCALHTIECECRRREELDDAVAVPADRGDEGLDPHRRRAHRAARAAPAALAPDDPAAGPCDLLGQPALQLGPVQEALGRGAVALAGAGVPEAEVRAGRPGARF